jgi:RNA polymerase sigma-70 factor (ECF subfamily)
MARGASVDPKTRLADDALIAAIRAGDEAAFVQFATAHHASLVRLARLWTKNAAIADEVVQDAWTTLLEGVDRFEGRSSLKTFLCGTVINIARARMRKEGRMVPMSSLGADSDEPSVDPSRFAGDDVPWVGHWSTPPKAFPDDPEGGALRAELRAQLEAAIAELPDPQRSVLVLRDVEGLSGEEVCNVLGLTDTHQRVLLHRARSKLRALLERAYAEGAK